MKKNICCIGAGAWGKNLVRNFHALGALRVVCETSAELRGGLSKTYPDLEIAESFERALDDPEIAAVAIATPAATHGAVVRRALEANKDVFVEKPLCLSLSEGRELVALAREKKRILMVGHILWYHPAILKLKALIETGELGRILYVYSNRLNLGKIRREENILWSFAPHDISVILGLLAEMPDKVTTQSGTYISEGISDVTMTLLSFPSGVKGHIYVSWLHPFKEQKLVVVGDKKMAVFDDTEEAEKLRLYPHSIEWKNRVPVAHRAEAEIVPLDPAEPLREECRHFLECVETRATPRTNGEEALRVLEVLERSRT